MSAPLSGTSGRRKAYVAARVDLRLAAARAGSRSAARLRRELHPQAHAPSPGGRLWKVAGIAAVFLLLGLLAATVAAVGLYQSYVSGFVPPDQVAINQPSLGAKIYDRNGKLLYEYVDDREGLRRPVKLDAISDAFLAATIATEDSSFFTNPGISFTGLARAFVENVNPFSDGFFDGPGGSSITQQLIKNVYIPFDERASRSIDRKLTETVYAIELTRRYSKAQILEWYVNQINYGSVYNGVEAASRGYFGKPASDLTLAEAALLAGLPQSPLRYDPRSDPEAALRRRNAVLDLMLHAGSIQIGEDRHVAYSAEEIEAAKQEPVVVAEGRFPIEAPHFVLTYVQQQLERILGKDAVYRQGLSVYTTLDLDLQNEAGAALERWISEFENSSHSRNGAVLVIDPPTGEIRVMIGSRDYFREDIQGTVNNLLAGNSPGSSFKPFVYLTSFLRLGWGPGTIIQDTPVTYREADGRVFQPQNPIVGSYQGNITIRNALGNSLNVPAFKTAQAVGVSDIVAAARKFGFTTLDGYYGPSIAIGGVDLTALDLTYAYSMLANGGVRVGLPVQPARPGERALEPIAISRVLDRTGKVVFDAQEARRSERVVPEEYAYLITSILTDPQAVCLTFGCNGLNVPGYRVAVKTGTSSPFDPSGPNAGKIGETWAFGYTRDFAVGVWAGNADNSPVVNIFSTSISFRTMRDTMLAAYRGRPQSPWQQPANLERRSVCTGTQASPAPSVTTAPAAGASVTCVEDLVVKVPVPFDLPGRPAVTAPTPAPAAPPAGSRGGEPGANISSPGGGEVRGVVAIFGTAASERMQFYRLEFGRGASPEAWSSIGQWSQPVSGGQLAAWNTMALEPGVYTLRLVVQDAARGTLTHAVRVQVVR
ncbi:MAG TPA: transglycosylase domain-containing protein [Dehalococcoidia bacterium]|nr:transglycosylase domain-containing protein [Dehalococcoidia bacterium]